MEPDNDDNCVEGGPFSKDKWRLLNVSGGGCLKRDFTKVSLRYNSKQVNKLQHVIAAPGRFQEIICLDYKACCMPHFAIGGTIKDKITANAPELLLHHSFVDKLWNQWQNKGEE